MHRNLRLPDHVPVVLRFNYDAHPKLEIAQLLPSYSVLAADTLRYTVILPFDLMTLIFDFCP